MIAAFERLGFRIVRDREHIAMIRDNGDGTRTPLTLQKHTTIKGSTLRSIGTQSRIPGDDFLDAYDRSSRPSFR